MAGHKHTDGHAIAQFIVEKYQPKTNESVHDARKDIDGLQKH